VVVLLAIAGLLAWGALLEANHGQAQARWFVYDSVWLFGLLALLGLHACCAVITLWPWRLQHIGFVLMHVGLLVLLTGALQSQLGGIEGRVSLVESETADHLILDRVDQLTMFWIGQPQERSLEFAFQGGPVDWPPGKTIELGDVDGISARVLGYYPQATAKESWVADESAQGGPAVHFSVIGPTDTRVAEGWLVDQQFGDAVSVGPIRLQLRQAVSERMVEDFRAPPTDSLGEKGMLTMYLDDEVQRVAVDTGVGRKIPLGPSGAEVEIAAYLPNAVPDRLGNFTTKGEQPKNPMLELRVYLPGEKQPLRQIAFAKNPLLNLDGVYARLCPVKFRYEHASVQHQNGVDLLQTTEGKLLGRLCVAAQWDLPREVHSDDAFDLPGQFRIQIAKHLPHAKRLVTFEAVDNASSRKARNKDQPAALVEIKSRGTSKQIWLRRADPAYGQQALPLPGGVLALSYEAARAPLGFSLKLEEIRRDTKPGNASNEIVSSVVRVVDLQQDLNEQHEISAGRPFTYRGFTFCEAGPVDAARTGKPTVFLVTHNPGSYLEYAGSLALCIGLAIMFATRTYLRSRRIVAVVPMPLALKPAVKSNARRQEPLQQAA